MPEDMEVNRDSELLLQKPEPEFGRRVADSGTKRLSGAGWLTRCLVLGVVAACLLLLTGYFKFGSMAVAYAYLNGERLMVSPVELHVPCHADERREVSFPCGIGPSTRLTSW
jgi:hypothetical protein